MFSTKTHAANTAQPLLRMCTSVKICSRCGWWSVASNQETVTHHAASSSEYLIGKNVHHLLESVEPFISKKGRTTQNFSAVRFLRALRDDMDLWKKKGEKRIPVKVCGFTKAFATKSYLIWTCAQPQSRVNTLSNRNMCAPAGTAVPLIITQHCISRFSETL